MDFQRITQMRKIILTLWLIFGLTSSGYPLNLTLTGAEITCDYDEPLTNVDGTPLTDLLKTTLYYERGRGTVKAKDVSAMSLTGGGHVTTTILVPVISGEDVMIRIWVTATDTAPTPNESVASSTESIRVDRLAPSRPR